ncbi:uncharacterized protein LOC127010340 isoform X2 [Eriocheir sinensis]|uniref:uncharacterized protein LOC127010340 isoform X2 n=1 Tax=Eriocheir sinensis TaxID=95602 RepID=UPI0021CA1BBA|nr:uncharacterized protein LOC127010340 isoform X2 [Eriocheir sinensis]XP_050740234.1 uncharacterized protein LOC127010340 isoform X2 [Eriocheir sinensis]
MNTLCLVVVGIVLGVVGVGVEGYSRTPTQYHIQTDEGPDRYFRFQTYTGQYRKEKRLDDGTVFGTYGWVDATGLLRLYDYIADKAGYRIVRTRQLMVPKVDPAAYQHLADRQPWNPNYRPKGQQQTQQTNQIQQPSQPVQQQQRPWQQTQQRPWQTQHQKQQQQRPWQQTQQPTTTTTTPSQSTTGSAVQPHDPADTSDLPAGGSFSINYDLGNQFHVEKIFADGRKVGRHGYVDPLGILRVSHYTAGPEGLVQRQESRWVGTRDPYTS